MMQKPLIFVAAIILLAGLFTGGFWLYDWVLGETLEASEPISAIPVEIDTPSADPTQVGGYEVDDIQTPAPGAGQQQEDEPKAADEDALPVESETGSDPADNIPEQPSLTIYSILPEQSEVRFFIYEELNGQPKTVVGTSSQVAGEAAIALDDLSMVQPGTIQVNARTFVTDDDRRNQAIRNRILHTDLFEFITFVPTSITGLAGSAVSGQTISFSVLGDLTIRSETRPASFDVTAQVETNGRISGSASAEVRRSDFNLIVPSVPFVANVGETVTLEIDFVMEAVER
jgi:polyisoprenoid-binding protein YceI